MTLTKARFRPFEVEGGRSIFVADVRKNPIGRGEAALLRSEDNLVEVRHQIILPGMDFNKELKDFSKGGVGYLAGLGPISEALVSQRDPLGQQLGTWDVNTGELTKTTRATPPERVVLLEQGHWYFSVEVLPDDRLLVGVYQFVLSASARVESHPITLVFGMSAGDAEKTSISEERRFASNFTQRFSVQGPPTLSTFLVFRYPEGERPNRQLALNMAGTVNGAEPLTIDDARQILKNKSLSDAFKSVMKPGERIPLSGPLVLTIEGAKQEAETLLYSGITDSLVIEPDWIAHPSSIMILVERPLMQQ